MSVFDYQIREISLKDKNFPKRLKKIKKAQNKRAEIHAAVIKAYKNYDI